MEEENESWSQSQRKLQEIVKDQLQFELNIEIQCGHRSGKTMIHGAPNKRRTIIGKFVT